MEKRWRWCTKMSNMGRFAEAVDGSRPGR